MLNSNLGNIISLATNDSIFELYPGYICGFSDQKGEITHNNPIRFGTTFNISYGREFNVDVGVYSMYTHLLEVVPNIDQINITYNVACLPKVFFELESKPFYLPYNYGMTKKMRELLNMFGTSVLSRLKNNFSYQYLAFHNRPDEVLKKLYKKLEAYDGSPLYCFMDIHGTIYLRSFLDLMNASPIREFEFINERSYEVLTTFETGTRKNEDIVGHYEVLEYNILNWEWSKKKASVYETKANTYVKDSLELDDQKATLEPKMKVDITDDIICGGEHINMIGRNMFAIRLSITTTLDFKLVSGRTIKINFKGKNKRFVHRIDGKWLILQSNHIVDNHKGQSYTNIIVGKPFI